jgi:bifunctional UDP-N-acetylglucosamine pyrophosphorylase / glucosamine-1-phosphate N-acetyltransferase
MASELPKVLHVAAHRTLIDHVLSAVAGVAPERIVVVVGYGADQVRAACRAPGVTCALQPEQRGTGDAVAAAAASLSDHPGPYLVVPGDAPLLDAAALRSALADHAAAGSRGVTLLTAIVDEPRGLGRIVRAPDGSVAAIVEERDADPATRALREVNPGVYVFDGALWGVLSELHDRNAAGEIYLTDAIARYRARGLPVRAVAAPALGRLIGVNDPSELARADALLRAGTEPSDPHRAVLP